VPTTTPSARAAFLPAAVMTLVASCVLLAAGVAWAVPAAALEDPRRPTVRVTDGPGCDAAVVRAVVTNGQEAHRVALVLGGVELQASAELAPGQQVELVSRDIGSGETVDVSVTVADLDGTAEDPLEQGTYTRPSVEDCASASTPAAVRGTSGGDSGGPVGQASAAAVSPGGVLTVRASGFSPGERVVVSLTGGDPLTTVTAGPDGNVEAVVQIPRGVTLGTVTVQLVGRQSAATAAVELQVAARVQPVAASTGSPPTGAAAVALLGTAGLLGLVAARRSREPASGG
jgi:hypothetical protein